MLFVPGTADALPGLALQGLLDWLLQLFIATLRCGGFLIAAPMFGARQIPVMVRIVLSVALGLLVLQIVPLPSPQILATPAVLPVIATELAIGLTAGLVLTIFFAAASVAGDRIAATSGLGFAAQFDPMGGGQTPVVSQFFALFLVAIFLAQEGHLAALSILIDSYRIIPVGAPANLPALTAAGIAAGGQMLFLAALIMLPVVAALLLINITIGVITRSAPQLNLFSFGFPVTLLATFALLFVNVPHLAHAFADLTGAALAALRDMIGGLADG
ncbi:flagellar biosynthetic protein FliR [Plastorhodobacter daqingensis]|uniref:Flagellar biosynthetic protein FliR n=1 Tax=Plastorhodobacter daqingensis TaxID=1387281 RepID=A0ABW2UKC2_9RHOB